MALIEHLEKLRHFHKITQFRSINEAAQSTGLSQAGLSKSIAALEQALETQLFLRTPQGLILTKEGQVVLDSTKKIISESSNLELRLRSLKAAKVPEKLKIGMYDSIAVYFFTELKNYLEATYQGLQLELTVDTSPNLIAAIANQQVDLAVGVNLDRQTGAHSEFFLLFEDTYAFYVASSIDSYEDSLPLIVHPRATDFAGTAMEDRLEKIQGKRGVHRAFNFETIKTLTLQGLGIGILPTQVAKPLVEQKQLRLTTISKSKSHFGTHSIGFLASKAFLKGHRDFAHDLYRLGQRWSKS